MSDTFTNAYIECATWSSTDVDGEPLDDKDAYLALETIATMQTDCSKFQHDNAELLATWYETGESEERAGHDFWLTRNYHGAGFWDRTRTGDQRLNDKLTDAAHAYGECDLYIGDDGLIYQS